MKTFLDTAKSRRRTLVISVLLAVFAVLLLRVYWDSQDASKREIYTDDRKELCADENCPSNIKELKSITFNPLRNLTTYLVFDSFFFSSLLFFLLFVTFQYLQNRKFDNQDSSLFYIGYLIISICYFSRQLQYNWWDDGRLFYEFFNSKQVYLGETFISTLFSTGYLLFIYRLLETEIIRDKWIKICAINYCGLCIAFAVIDPIWGFTAQSNKTFIELEIAFKAPLHLLLFFIFVRIIQDRTIGKNVDKRLIRFILIGSVFLYFGAGLTALIGLFEINVWKYLTAHFENETQPDYFLDLYEKYCCDNNIPNPITTSLAKQLPFKIGVLFENFFFILGLGYKTSLTIEEKRKAEKAYINARLAAIRAQLDPHFVSNAFTHAQETVWKGKDKSKASDLLAKLARLVRNILKVTDKEKISLANEIKLCEDYANIRSEMMAPTKNISYIDIRKETNYEYLSYLVGTVKIPPLTLQPLIENAFKHAFSDSKTTSGLIRISIPTVEEGERVSCIISDDGKGMTKEKIEQIQSRKFPESDAGEERGWKLLAERFDLSGIEYKIDSEVNKGTTITLYFDS